MSHTHDHPDHPDRHDHEHPSIAVLTGAGISTGGGIPDFRGPKGVWTRDPSQAELLDIDAYMASADVRERCWLMWRDHPAWRAHATAAHRAIVELERAGELIAVLTQNFDGLHQAAGQSPGLVVELHGSLGTTSCLRCAEQWVTRDVLARLAVEPDPHHAGCGGILKPDIVYFGELLPDEALQRAVAAAQDAQVFVAVGTTLRVQPVASLAAIAADCGAELILVNDQETPYDELAARIVREPIDVAVPALVEELLAR
ncbi:MAG TPA: Sir2 family NAD-dependent protein deacetylase [Cellulomonas sp.]